MSPQDVSTKELLEEGLSLQELLGIAVKAEIEAADIYRNLLEKDLSEQTREKLEKLVLQEERHEKKFWSIIRDFYPEEEITLPEDSGITNPVEIDDNTSLEELFRIAMESEVESEKFYRSMREKFEDKEVKRTLGFLAASERGHYETLKDELNRLD